MIGRVELNNWKTHAHTEINFRKGTNVLIGIMGAGKSSVMDAISFAFFGTFPALKHKRVSLEDVITNRPREMESGEVLLEFSVGGNDYSVKRVVDRKGGSSALLKKNGENLQSQPERVNEEIERILGLNYDTFSRAIYAEQNRLDYILELRKGDRKKQIDEMLNLDRFAGAEENATSLINSVRNAIEDEEKMLSGIDADSSREQLMRLSEERGRLESGIKEAEGKAAEGQKAVERDKNELEGYKKEYDRKKKIDEQISALTGRTNTLRSEIAKIKNMGIDEEGVKRSIGELEGKVATLSEENAKLRSEEGEVAKRMGKLESDKSVLEKRTREKAKINEELAGSKKDELERDVVEKTKTLRELTESAAGNRSRLEEETKWMKELEKHMGTCPICRRELDDALRKKLIEERRELVDKLKKDVARLESEKAETEMGLKESTERYGRLEKRMDKLDEKEYASVEKDLDEVGRTIEKEEGNRKALAAKIKGIEKELEESKNAYNVAKMSLDHVSRMETYEDELVKEGARTRELKKEESEIKIDEKKLYDLQDSLAKKISDLSNLKSTVEGERKYLAGIEKQIEDKTKEIARFESMKSGIETRKLIVSDLNKFRDSLKDTETLLRSNLVKSVNSIMQSLWPKLYPYGDYTSLRLSAKRDDYELEINALSEGEEGWKEVDSVASGGERSITALALRIALSMVIVPNLKWLILDEPTHNLDRAGISKLIEVLGNTLPKIVEQVFIITHDENLREISSAAVYMLDRDKAASGATVVGELS